MLTVNTLATQNASSPGKMVLVQINRQLFGMVDKLDDSRADAVIYQGQLLSALPRAVQGEQTAKGERDKVAIGVEEDPVRLAVRSALEKYLTDNGAKPVCQSHLAPLTDAVVAAIAPVPAPAPPAEEPKKE